jgi:hypothetical protein
MDSRSGYLYLADAILVLHVFFAAFVVCGLLLIYLGKACGWSWIYNPWFRLLHLLAIIIVAVQSWFGMICPLTSFEMTLRSQGGGGVYSGSFIAHLLESILYYRAPAWVFTVCYTLFGLIVAASWVWIRPRPFTRPSSPDQR